MRLWLSNAVNQAEIDGRVAQLNSLNEAFDSKLGSDGRKWIAGDQITIADFAVGAAYHSIVLNKHIKHSELKKAVLATLTDREHLKRWLERISE